ncbi:MAG: ABC transporter permease subunit [Coprobacillus sp.]
MKKSIEIKIIYWFVIGLFALFLVVPLGSLLIQSFQYQGSISLQNYISMFSQKGFLEALKNSFMVSGLSALITVLLAFIIAYAINYTNILQPIKKSIKSITMLPMLLPTITYGFAIIYSFGKQGLWTKIFGFQLFDIYGMNGLILGYVIYTLPIAFMLIHNAMEYIDKKFIVVSKLMEDSQFKTFIVTLIRPLLGTLVAAFIQSFFLSFTDFGIPASVGGKFEVVSSVLYTQMLGSIPDFAKGAVVAMMMLIPSILSILVLHYLEKYNIRYNKISKIEFKKNKIRDITWGSISIFFNIIIIAIFAVIFLMPFIKEWPYNISFTLSNITSVLNDSSLLGVIENSLIVSILTAIGGTLIVYGAALVVARSRLNDKLKKVIESIVSITNTVPGMVLGIAYLLIFSGTPIQNTFVVIIICNIVHFFSSPYLMMKNSLMKMNAGYETTARLMGDSWFKTIRRVVTPNAISSLLEVFSYYFINAMVTVSAVIFIAGAKTMVMTTKIKELQHFAKFNEIFVLSIFILLINLISKALFQYFIHKKKKEKTV